MTSKSSGKAPPSVGSVITCPPVRVDGSSSVPAQPFGVLRRAMYTPERAKLPSCLEPSATTCPSRHSSSKPDERVEEPHYNTGESRRNNLCIGTFGLGIIG